MNTDNKTVREKAIEWWNKRNDKEKHDITVYWYNQEKILHGNFHNLTGREIEDIHILEKPKETPKEQTKGVIEGMDEAADKGFEGIKNKHVNDLYRTGFNHGSEWHHDTHYMPLLEELNKMKQSFYMDICRAYNAGKKCINNQHQDAREKGKEHFSDKFISSHDYFKGEFPEFETNVP